MATQKAMGRKKLAERLTAQVGSKSLAYALLNKRGDMKGSKLTAKGKKRDAMTAAERAKDRASKKTGKKPSEFKYNRKTNQATLKGKK